MSTFNPTTNLEQVQKAEDLRDGDKYLRAYFNGDEMVTCTLETFRSYHAVDHLFTAETSRKIFFIEKVARHVKAQKGHYGVATMQNGDKRAGFWDSDGDFATLNDYNMDAYYAGEEDIIHFEDLGPVIQPKQAEPEGGKTEGLMPGRDPKPSTNKVWDKDGDEWDLNGDHACTYSFNLSGTRSWDNPSETQKGYAPYTTVKPNNAR